MATLAEELRLLSLPAPDKISVDEFDGDLTNARVVSKDEFCEEESGNIALGQSKLRTKTAILLADEDTRYVGKTVSRRDLLKLRGDIERGDDIESELEMGLELVTDENSEFDGNTEDESNKSIEESSESGEVGGETADVEAQEDEKEEENGKSESGKNNIERFLHLDSSEVEKGKTVVHQIAMWDSLLENRIRLQKILTEVNKLPQHEVFNDVKVKGGSQLTDPLNNTRQLLTNLLHNLLILQQKLFERNSDTVGILSFKNKAFESDEDIASDDGDIPNDDDTVKDADKKNDDDRENLKLPRKRKQSMHLDEYSQYIAKRHAAFEHFRDATIKKWNEKTRLASGKVNNKSFNSFDRSTLNQIKQILSDKERLIKRTQLKRSTYRILGKTQELENMAMEQRDVHLKDYDAEIFDDDDFYHQLLREFIERKSNVDPNDPIAMGRQWLEIQRLRNKVKRKVDTKASKGRRLRFDVHPKLVSFMAPQTRGTMPDSSRNELFSSLFGERQPQESADISIFR